MDEPTIGETEASLGRACCPACGRIAGERGARDRCGAWRDEAAIARMDRDERLRRFGSPIPLVRPLPPCPRCQATTASHLPKAVHRGSRPRP